MPVVKNFCVGCDECRIAAGEEKLLFCLGLYLVDYGPIQSRRY